MKSYKNTAKAQNDTAECRLICDLATDPAENCSIGWPCT